MSDIFLFRRKKRKVQINITSLIDVLFLLLIFFMVTSTFVKNPGIDISLPKISKGTNFSQQNVIEIAVTKDKLLYVDGKKISVEELADTVKRLKEMDKTSQVFLKADTLVPYGFIVKIMNALQLGGIKNVAAITEEVKEINSKFQAPDDK
ncbi:MAG: biopolymer transporter ExbD [Candidatus Aureabacteria bacterium]|nr:biopolymer transporter ExbD [Candidatus Auribacterota bacterium]